MSAKVAPGIELVSSGREAGEEEDDEIGRLLDDPNADAEEVSARV